MLISNSTDVVRKDSIEELCGHRARALQLYVQGYDTLLAARDAHERACYGSTKYLTQDFLSDMNRGFGRRPDFEAAARKAIDRDMWQGFIIGTPIGSLMDKQERDAFREQVQKDPPECTMETVLATMSRLAGEANMIFRRGLVNAFQRLSHDYKSHDGFKLGQRCILTYVVSAWGDRKQYFSPSGRSDGELQDVDRVMHVLDGKDAPEYQTGIAAALRTAVGQKVQETETDYFRLRWFKNGNAHLYFKRPDLVEKANKLIAEHFGDALGASHSARTAAR